MSKESMYSSYDRNPLCKPDWLNDEDKKGLFIPKEVLDAQMNIYEFFVKNKHQSCYTRFVEEELEAWRNRAEVAEDLNKVYVRMYLEMQQKYDDIAKFKCEKLAEYLRNEEEYTN